MDGRTRRSDRHAEWLISHDNFNTSHHATAEKYHEHGLQRGADVATVASADDMVNPLWPH